MFSFLLIVFVFVVMTIIFVLAVLGAIIFRKKSTHSNPRIDPDNVIDVTSREVK